MSGNEVLDTIKIGALTITNQSIGAATFAGGFQGVDGILGYSVHPIRSFEARERPVKRRAHLDSRLCLRVGSAS